jgi:predicted permease
VRVDGASAEEVHGRYVSGGFFHVLGVDPAIGRTLATGEDRGEAPYAVLSHHYWQHRFGGRSDVLGRAIRVGKAHVTIVGVAPPGFIGETAGQSPDLWLPLRAQPRVEPTRDRLRDTPPEKSMWLHVFGRLKPGVSDTQAEAEANAVFQAGLESFYGAAASGDQRAEYLDQRLEIRSGARGASPTRAEYADSLSALLAAVGVLLLVACANLANLLLARGAARTPEMALRLSLGASRGRLIAQLATESLLLAAMGGVTALAVAYFLHASLVRMIAQSDSQFAMTFSLDPLVLAFAVATTLAAALLFGVLPAWYATKTSAAISLKVQGRGLIGSSGRMRSGRFLVSLQLALSLPLLFGAGLLAQTVYNLQRTDLGFSSERLLLVRVDLRESVPDPIRRDQLRHELLVQFRQLPGVRAASHSQLGVFSGGNSSASIDVEGYVPSGDRDRESDLDRVGPGYFAALGARIQLGRDIEEQDHGDAPKVCVINEAFARQFFDGRNPIGLRVTWIDDDQARAAYQVVGVADNVRTQHLRGEIPPRFFVPVVQRPPVTNSPTFLIRTTTEPALVMEAVRTTLQRVDPALSIVSASSVQERMAPLTAQDRTSATLAEVFGCVALALAAVGLYGVLSYGVARRTSEIAVRLALGAVPGRVISMLLRETAALVGAGLAVGGGLAYTASRLIDSRLHGVAARDPLTLASATGLLLVVALTAAYLPARRASRLNPVAALRR